MQPEIKSITIYIREGQFESFLRGELSSTLSTLKWTLTPGDTYAGSFFSHKQVQVQVSLDTYFELLDSKKDNTTISRDTDMDDYMDSEHLYI